MCGGVSRQGARLSSLQPAVSLHCSRAAILRRARISPPQAVPSLPSGAPPPPRAARTFRDFLSSLPHGVEESFSDVHRVSCPCPLYTSAEQNGQDSGSQAVSEMSEQQSEAGGRPAASAPSVILSTRTRVFCPFPSLAAPRSPAGCDGTSWKSRIAYQLNGEYRRSDNAKKRHRWEG